MNKWIPIGKDLPKKDQEVYATILVDNEKSVAEITYRFSDFDKKYYWSSPMGTPLSDNVKVIAWMPIRLPLPYVTKEDCDCHQDIGYDEECKKSKHCKHCSCDEG